MEASKWWPKQSSRKAFPFHHQESPAEESLAPWLLNRGKAEGPCRLSKLESHLCLLSLLKPLQFLSDVHVSLSLSCVLYSNNSSFFFLNLILFPFAVLVDLATETAKYVFPERFEARTLEEALMSGIVFFFLLFGFFYLSDWNWVFHIFFIWNFMSCLM